MPPVNLGFKSHPISGSSHKAIKLLTDHRLTSAVERSEIAVLAVLLGMLRLQTQIGDNEPEPRGQQERVNQHQGFHVLP
jgi:hypothetical protein